MPSDYDNVVIINQGWEFRQAKSGKTRAVITVKSEPLIFNLDPKAAGKPVAAAIVQHIRDRIAGITELAAPATLKARQVAARAFAAGKPWALKRYSGGKMGAMPPNQSDRAMNDSGRMAKSVTGSASSDGQWRINVAGNRLSGDTSRGVQFIYDKLVSLVPELARPELMLESPSVTEAIGKAMQGMVIKGKATSSKLAVELVRGWIEVAEAAMEVVEGLIEDAA